MVDYPLNKPILYSYKQNTIYVIYLFIKDTFLKLKNREVSSENYTVDLLSGKFTSNISTQI